MVVISPKALLCVGPKRGHATKSLVPQRDLSSEPWNPGSAPGLGSQCQVSTLRHSLFPGEGVSGGRYDSRLQDSCSCQQA